MWAAGAGISVYNIYNVRAREKKACAAFIVPVCSGNLRRIWRGSLASMPARRRARGRGDGQRGARRRRSVVCQVLTSLTQRGQTIFLIFNTVALIFSIRFHRFTPHNTRFLPTPPSISARYPRRPPGHRASAPAETGAHRGRSRGPLLSAPGPDGRSVL